jgi:hypothetical protein
MDAIIVFCAGVSACIDFQRARNRRMGLVGKGLVQEVVDILGIKRGRGGVRVGSGRCVNMGGIMAVKVVSFLTLCKKGAAIVTSSLMYITKFNDVHLSLVSTRS